jgi:hypothetical protein
MDNMFGMMGQFIKETLSKVIGMVMEFGVALEATKTTRATTCLIRNTVMEFMIGEMGTIIKGLSLKI